MTDSDILGPGQWPQGKVPGAPAVSGKGGQPAYFSVWDIHAYYGESYIVQGVSFDIREGEIVALLGRNGAGKTSTLRALARVDDPALKHGEIWLDHQPLHDMKAHEASRCGIGLVPEDRRIIQGLTVEENLQLAQIAPPHGWSIERLYDLFPRLGERRKQEGTTLSGGEQQMLAVARALARDVTDQGPGHDDDHRRAERDRRAASGRPRHHPGYGPGGVRRHRAGGARQRRTAPRIPGDLILGDLVNAGWER
jgi:ABC-type transport system involved in cytochrome c biogenesis ATPase subunit